VKENKTAYRILVIATFVGINAMILFGISQILTYLNTGADPSLLFHGDAARTGYYTPELVWREIENPGRPLDEAMQKHVESDYLDAWFIRNTALKNLSVLGIEDFYTESARKNLEATIRQNTLEEVVVETTTLSHHVSLDYFSADGQVVVLTDENVTSYSRVFKNENLILETDESGTYKVVLLLEDGFWRIRHLEKIEVLPESVAARPDFKLETHIKGVNYYPQSDPWDTFGSEFLASVLDSDFKIIKGLGLNTIRIFVGYEDFGKANVAQAKLEKLIKLLDKAEANELRVIVTLFDFYGDYSIPDWTLTQTHARTIVKRLKNHKALFAWNVKNEPDLDFENRGSDLVKAWLKQMINTIRMEDPEHPITIGWSSASAAINLVDAVDFVAFHFYEDINKLPDAVSALKAHSNKPIILEEFGLSTYHGIWNLLGPDESNQKEFFELFLENQKRDSLHYLFWTLYDFPKIPNEVAGPYPWRKNKQRNFGIIDIDGLRKEAFHVLNSK
jgi:hypothetical protein